MFQTILGNPSISYSNLLMMFVSIVIEQIMYDQGPFMQHDVMATDSYFSSQQLKYFQKCYQIEYVLVSDKLLLHHALMQDHAFFVLMELMHEETIAKHSVSYLPT